MALSNLLLKDLFLQPLKHVILLLEQLFNLKLSSYDFGFWALLRRQQLSVRVVEVLHLYVLMACKLLVIRHHL
jgi:hypothetical protein